MHKGARSPVTGTAPHCTPGDHGASGIQHRTSGHVQILLTLLPHSYALLQSLPSELACLCLTPQRSRITHNRHRISADIWTERKSDPDNSRRQAIHTGDSPAAPGAGKQETLHYSARQSLFFVKPLLSKVDDVADFADSQSPTQKGG